jgi:hypothetical protein
MAEQLMGVPRHRASPPALPSAEDRLTPCTVSRKQFGVSHIEANRVVAASSDHVQRVRQKMTASDKMTLVLGGTGRTGSRLAQKLAKRAVAVRTAARHGTDVTFDWDEPSTHVPALQGVDRMYLVTPVGRIRFAPQVSGLLDLGAPASPKVPIAT